MQLKPPNKRIRGCARPGVAGIALLECLVYISMLFLVLGMAFAGFYSALEHSRRLTRSAADVSRALQAGERWRQDVRLAVAAPRRVDQAGQTVFAIPQRAGEVQYLFQTNHVFRKAGPGAVFVLVLDRVEDSAMHFEHRPSVPACRWELALQPIRKPARLKPLFTFQAVPEKRSSP